VVSIDDEVTGTAFGGGGAPKAPSRLHECSLAEPHLHYTHFGGTRGWTQGLERQVLYHLSHQPLALIFLMEENAKPVSD
jgi:hypothetical protein